MPLIKRNCQSKKQFKPKILIMINNNASESSDLWFGVHSHSLFVHEKRENEHEKKNEDKMNRFELLGAHNNSL